MDDRTGPSKAISLMDALRRSVEGGADGRRGKDPARRASHGARKADRSHARHKNAG